RATLLAMAFGPPGATEQLWRPTWASGGQGAAGPAVPGGPPLGPRRGRTAAPSGQLSTRVSQVIAWWRKVGRGLDAGRLPVQPHDLLHAATCVAAVPARLEQPAVGRVGGDVYPQSSGEGLAEQDVPMLGPLHWLILILETRSTSVTLMLHNSLTLTPV